MNINAKVKILREQKGVSQYRMADDLGISRSIIVNWERGRTTPNIEHLKLLSSYFNTPLDELTSNDAPQSTTEDQILDLIETYYRTHEFSKNVRFHRSIDELFYEYVEQRIKK